MVIDGVEVFGTDIWDDINWLWPLFVQALEECRQTGAGVRAFPDQPISINVERDRARPSHTLLRVNDGDKIRRGALAPSVDLYNAVAHAGTTFFEELGRFCAPVGPEAQSVLERWLTRGAQGEPHAQMRPGKGG